MVEMMNHQFPILVDYIKPFLIKWLVVTCNNSSFLLLVKVNPHSKWTQNTFMMLIETRGPHDFLATLSIEGG
mgnify:CR=1 FL=1